MNHSKLEAVLFDVDGTLADTERNGHRLAFNAAFQDFGLNWNWDVEIYGKLLLTTGGKERILHFINQYNPDLPPNIETEKLIIDLHHAKTKYYVSLLNQGRIPLRPGVSRLIQQLREKKIKIAIATTTTPENVTALLKASLGQNAINWFDFIAAGDIVTQKKPAPDIYLWTLEQLGLSPEQCIAIEDSENGLQSAYAAKITTLITVNSYTAHQNFTKASLILSDLGEPARHCTVLAGHMANKGWVDPEVLEYLLDHEFSVSKNHGPIIQVDANK